ncbi:MAG: lantibiotic dehydratase family protein [Prevotellaceae bacterium]|jgi:hypothetical protein|nr:lantibiotic dehydratase family protein [Prevotellaceae bacterium]
MREMLQIATPDLSEGIGKSADKAQYSAYRYYQRACTRPTPFGLFAGCSVGTIGSDYSKIFLSKQKEYKRNTRLDMNYICALIQQIERSKNIREQLLYYPNSSLYPVGNFLRYVEYYYRKIRRIHHIKQIENSEYIQKILTLAKQGARFSKLAAVLVDDEISMEEAIEFIHELIDAQVLVSELEPAVTNVRPLSSLIAKLNGLSKADKQIISVLSEIEAQLNYIDQQYIGDTADIYPEIINHITKTKVAAEIKYLFQTDMFKPVLHATVSRHLLKEIQQALIFLNKVTPPVTQPYLTQFKENFTKRYEDREMPLLFVLDNELGIGYADKTSGDISPLVDDLAVPNRNSPPQVSQSPIQSVLLQKYQPSMQKVIELTDKDVKDFVTKWDDLPPTISVVCEILQDNDRGCSISIKYAGGQSAANLLGRFCHLDEQVLSHTLAIIQKEALLNPDVIYAEIVHLPESRIGNILLRPVLRPYEIPYLAKTGIADPVHNGVLSPDDLFVSVKNNRILLRSKRLNKEIVPRMSTAHNYSGLNPMPVYHFLCDMQHQDKRSGLGIFWSDAAQQLDYLPRIVYKSCILSKARWTVRKKDIKEFVDIKDDSELLIEIKQWRERRNIPDRVVLVDGDNELYIDMNHPLSIRAWLPIVKKRPSFRLEEFLFDSTTAVVRGEEGVFTNEFIFAFYRGNL